MKKFLSDYKDLCKHYGTFYKSHWVATIVVTAIGTILSVGGLLMTYVIEKKKDEKEIAKIIKRHFPTERES